MHHAAHVVEVAVVHREPGEPGPPLASIRSSTVSSDFSDSTRIRGSSALPRCGHRSAATGPAGSRCPRSSVPCCGAASAPANPSSCGERAERSSSAGSTPSRRTIQFAAPFSAEINQRNTTGERIDTQRPAAPSAAAWRWRDSAARARRKPSTTRSPTLTRPQRSRQRRSAAARRLQDRSGQPGDGRLATYPVSRVVM